MTSTQATIRFGPGSAVGVAPFIRLTGDTLIHCCTYDDQAPILAIEDGCVSVSITVPDTRHVTGQDVNQALALADAVAKYVAELGEHLADDDCGAPDAVA